MKQISELHIFHNPFVGLEKLKWSYDQIEFLGLSHRIPRKIKNAVYRLHISALFQSILNCPSKEEQCGASKQLRLSTLSIKVPFFH